MAVKKPTAAKAAAKPAAKKLAAKKENNSWIGEVEKYSRQIWLAGLGAYSKISNDGNKLFDGLVKDGEKAEKKAKTEVDKQLDVVKSSVGSHRRYRPSPRSMKSRTRPWASGASWKRPSTSA